MKRKFEKCVSSPSLSQNLIGDSESDETPQKKVKTDSEDGGEGGPGSLLRRGIKFASKDEFLKFMTSTEKKKERRQKKKEERRAKKIENQNESAEKILKDESAKFNVAKIKEMFSSSKNSESNEKKTVETTPKNEHKNKLQSAHFRHLNEQLYTQTGSQSLKMFKKDPDAFKIYHEGFMSQAKKWPTDPLDKIIASIMKISGNITIADFGCGEARLARSFQGSEDVKVHSFDLVKINDYVTVCDFANVPLEDESCNMAVFCLSLMGTNLRDFIKEANRVLKIG